MVAFEIINAVISRTLFRVIEEIAQRDEQGWRGWPTLAAAESVLGAALRLTRGTASIGIE